MSKMKLSYKILTFDGNNYWGENGGFLKTPNDNHFERDLNSFNFKNIQFKANDNELGVINFPSNVLINKYNLNSLIMTVTNIFKTTIFQLNNLKLDIDTHIKEIFNEKLLVFSKDYFNLLDHEYYDLKLNKCKIDLDYFRKLNSLSQKNCYLSIREDDFLNTLPTLKLMVNDVMYNCKEEVLNDYVKEGKIIEKQLMLLDDKSFMDAVDIKLFSNKVEEYENHQSIINDYVRDFKIRIENSFIINKNDLNKFRNDILYSSEFLLKEQEISQEKFKDIKDLTNLNDDELIEKLNIVNKIFIPNEELQDIAFTMNFLKKKNLNKEIIKDKEPCLE